MFPVAPGSSGYNLLCGAQVAGIIHADFDRTGTVEETDQERAKRIVRPGAIVLANLDIDDPLPSPAPADLSTLRDATKDAVINGGNDLDDTTLFKIRMPNPCSVTATRIALVIDPADGSRIHVWQVDGGAPGTWALRMGPGTGRYELPNSSVPFAFDFRMEALTLAGDPGASGATGATPDKPDPYPADLPSGSSGTPVYAARLPGEIWLEVQNSGAVSSATPPRDVALFTIAPFMVLSNLHQPTDVYVAEIPDQLIQFQSPPAAKDPILGNVPFVQDLQDNIPGGVTLNRVPFAACREKARDDAGNLISTFDGTTVFVGDPWVQDEFELGYCWAPQEWMHMVLHCRRNPKKTGLWNSVRTLAGPKLGLYVGINGADNSLNFGGNLEVSPPVAKPTPELPVGDAGPKVHKHPAAPFGKIFVGDDSTRPVNVVFRNFLQAQKAQPVLPLDTSWLAVGHVDEIISFVNAPATSPEGVGGKGFAMLFASADRAIQLLRKVEGVAGVTNMFRSRKPHDGGWEDLPSTGDGLSIGAVLAKYEPFTSNPARPLVRGVHAYQRKLDSIIDRLKAGLDINENDVLRMPVLFHPGTTRTAAYTPGVVNLLSLGNTLIIPKPWGPRVSVADATAALNGVAHITSGMISAANLPNLRGEWYWAQKGELTSDIAAMFGADEVRILLDNSGGIDGTGTITPNWKRLWIWEDSVDIFEAFIAVKLRNIGLEIKFVDDWDVYHVAEGEIHCGTNVKRNPPETTAAPRWWDHYQDLAGVDPYTV